jgi:hypothetical protein
MLEQTASPLHLVNMDVQSGAHLAAEDKPCGEPNRPGETEMMLNA